jgi:hypothetical protein
VPVRPGTIWPRIALPALREVMPSYSAKLSDSDVVFGARVVLCQPDS